MSETSLSPKRQKLDYDDSSSKEDHYDKYKNRDREHDEQNNFSQSKHRKRSDPEEEDGKEEDGKTKTINVDTARREHTLVMRLTNKEQELQDCMNQIQEMKQAQTQNTAQLRSMLLDPAINLVFQRMAKEMDEHKEKLKQKQNELSAGKFTRDSQTGRRMMARCRLLLQENADLGKMISSGRTARLEGEIVLHKALVTEMKKNQKELDEFVGELEEDVEGMQGMIFMLQQQLKEAREQIARLQQENEQLRTLRMPPDPEPGGGLVGTCNKWPAEAGSESEIPISKLLVSSVHLGKEPSNGTDSATKRTSPIIPPVLSGRGKISANTLDHSTHEEFSSFAGNTIPDSGMHSQEKEDESMDTSDFAASLSQRHKQQCDDSDHHQLNNSDPELTSTAAGEHAGCGSLQKESQPRAEKTASLSGTLVPVNSDAAKDIPDGNLRTTPVLSSPSSTAAAAKSGKDSALNCMLGHSDTISERTTELPNSPAATGIITDGQLKQPSEDSEDMEEYPTGRANCSNQNKNERTSTLIVTDNETGGKKTCQDNSQDESKSTLQVSLGLGVGKVEDDKLDCQTRLGLVNGSSSLPGQGL